jgi:hypothetical protein
MKFFKYDDRIVESFKDCKDHVINSSTFVNYDKITCVKIIDKSPYFTVYFSNDKFLEIDKIHLDKFLEGIK